MRSGSLSTSTRRALVGIAVTALLCGASGLRAQQEAPDQLRFNSEAGIIIFQVQGARTADFESAWMDIKSKLAASDKPDFRELGSSINIFKMADPPAGGDVIYVFELNPPSRTLSYDPAKILYAPDLAVPREEADATYAKIRDSLTSLNVLPLQKLGGGMGMGMGMGGM